MSDNTGSELTDRARVAFGLHEWDEAFDLLMRADAAGSLPAGDLPLLGETAYAAGHLDACIEAWERAHAASMLVGDDIGAAAAAVRVAMHVLFDTALMAPVRGWLARAETLLERHPDTPAHAWFAVVRSYERMLTGDLSAARQWARRAVEIGSVCEPAACAVGRVADGRLLILAGDVGQGLALLDEAGVAALSGDLDPLSRGVVYCELVCALQGLALYDLAQEWTEGDGAVVRLRRGRQPSRALPCAPRRDPATPRLVRRGGAAGVTGLRGAAALPAPGARLAPQRARAHPTPQG